MATRVPAKTTETMVAMHFPLAGVDLTTSLEKQRARKVGEDHYARTTPQAVNVRGDDVVTGRSRGSQRAGLRKFISTPTVEGWLNQELATIVSVGGGAVQQSNSGRVVSLIAVNQGNVYYLIAGGTTWTAATNSTSPFADPPLVYTGLMQSASNGQKLYFADGTNWVYYDPATTSVNTWMPGTSDLEGNPITSVLPVDSDGNTPRLICNWRGSIVLAGLLGDPHNWFKSATDDPRNFDYSPGSQTPTQATAGNNSPAGLVGDVVTALIPYTDDVLVFGGDHSIYMMRGDPMAGGQIDLVSDTIGMAFGAPWCKDPVGVIYFFSNRCGIYTLIPGQAPQRVSQAIDQELLEIDTSDTVRMIWDDRFQGLHVFVSPTDAPRSGATHWFYEQRTGAWQPDRFANKLHDPLCCCVFDGNEADDRVALIGSWDGYVRVLDPDSSTDDGTEIESEVVIGPIVTDYLDDMMVKSIQAVLGEESGDVTYSIYVGKTAEEALASDPVQTGTWTSGRNPTNLVRRAGHAVYVKLSSTVPWSMETIRALVDTKGGVRQRSKY